MAFYKTIAKNFCEEKYHLFEYCSNNVVTKGKKTWTFILVSLLMIIVNPNKGCLICLYLRNLYHAQKHFVSEIAKHAKNEKIQI